MYLKIKNTEFMLNHKEVNDTEYGQIVVRHFGIGNKRKFYFGFMLIN